MRTCVADFEANGLLDEATQVWCGVFKDIRTEEVFEFLPDQIQEMLSFIEREVSTLIIHNGVAYDFPLLRRLHGFNFNGKKVDTLLMSRLQRPNRPRPHGCPTNVGPHSIQAWGYRVGRGKVSHEEWSCFSPEMLHRCREDVEILHSTYNALINEGKDEGWEHAHKLNTKLFTLLQRQEEYGWTVDHNHLICSLRMLDLWIERIDRAINPRLPIKVDVLETKKDGEYNYVRKPFRKNGELSDISVRWLDSISDVVHPVRPDICGPFVRLSFRKLDLDKSAEIKGYLLEQGWEPAEWNTNSNGEKTSPKMSKDDPWEGIQGSVGKLIAKRVQCKHRRSVLEGWQNAIRKDGRIPSIITGLTYTSRAKHSVIANVPRPTSFFGKWMRKLFIAKPGWVLVGTDSDANHYRHLAALMGDTEFKQAVVEGKKEEGTDMHSLNKRKIGQGTRDQAKIFFYALLLGAQPPRLSKVLNCSVKEAKVLREGFMDTMPALKALLDKLIGEWRGNAKQWFNPKWNKIEYKDGWFKGLDGRRVYCERESEVLAYLLQNYESVQMATAYCIFHKWMDKAGYIFGEDYGTVCWYHDEYTVECKPEIKDHVAKLMERSIKWSGEYYNIDCPHVGNAQVGLSWADIH